MGLVRFPLPRGGFTLVELLTVVLLTGILTMVGTSFYAGLTRETRERTQLDGLRSFLSACRQRAVLRGIPVRVQLLGDVLSPVDSPGLSCHLGPMIDEKGRLALAGLHFTATAAWRAGQPVSSISLALGDNESPQESPPPGKTIVLSLLEF